MNKLSLDQHRWALISLIFLLFHGQFGPYVISTKSLSEGNISGLLENVLIMVVFTYWYAYLIYVTLYYLVFITTGYKLQYLHFATIFQGPVIYFIYIHLKPVYIAIIMDYHLIDIKVKMDTIELVIQLMIYLVSTSEISRRYIEPKDDLLEPVPNNQQQNSVDHNQERLQE